MPPPLPSRFYVAAGPDLPDLLIDYLVTRFPSVSRLTWIDRMQRGRVRYVDGTPLSPEARLPAGSTILYDREVPDEPEAAEDARIVFRDERIVVADKPPFIPVTPAGQYLGRSLLAMLVRCTGLSELAPMHRLDRDTSGLVLFAIRRPDREHYHRLFAAHEVEREYLSVAPLPASEDATWRIANRLASGSPWFRQQVVEGPTNAVTDIELIERCGDRGLYRLRPQTGRKHQLRVHMASIGLPIENDRLYPKLVDDGGDDRSRPLRLVASRLSFMDPITRGELSFRSSYTQRVLSFPTTATLP